MKKGTVKLIRGLGIILMIISACLLLYSVMKFNVINGLSFAGYVLAGVAIYLVVASPKSLKSWSLFK